MVTKHLVCARAPHGNTKMHNLDLFTTNIPNEMPNVRRLPVSADSSAYNQPDALFAHAKIMMVDQDKDAIDHVEQSLAKVGIADFQASLDPHSVTNLIGYHQPDVVLVDLKEGFEILRWMRRHAYLEAVGVIILADKLNSDEKLAALELGASAFLTKPVHPTELILSIRNIIASKAYHDHLSYESNRLECEVRQRMLELVEARNEAEEARQEALQCLARAAEFRDDDTGNHVLRVGRYARIVAEHLGWRAEEVDVLEQAAQLHDVGKIGISDTILLKPGKLTSEEFDTMKRHCEFGSKIIMPMSDDQWDDLILNPSNTQEFLKESNAPVMKMAALIAQTHHEKWDGSGYPRGLKGEEIPLVGRITAIADVFDAISSERPYKKAFPIGKCLKIIQEGRGTHFDPVIVDAFFDCCDQIMKIHASMADSSHTPEKTDDDEPGPSGNQPDG